MSGNIGTRVVRSAPLFVVMVLTWLLLQGELTVANVVGGSVLALLLVIIFPVDGGVLSHRVHPVEFVSFVGFVLYSLVLSSWSVIKVILRPTPTSLRSGIVKVSLAVESPLTTTIVANAVTLTPGTMTLTARVHPAELHIHVLGLDDADEFRASVDDLERRTIAAFEPRFARGAAVPGGDPA